MIFINEQLNIRILTTKFLSDPSYAGQHTHHAYIISQWNHI